MDAKADQGSSAAFLPAERLASLSDTMFGVAMTLVVTTLLPTIQAHQGSASEALQGIRSELGAVPFSFGICGIYWMSQQRRLAWTRRVTPLQAVLHLVFLFLIVLVPITVSISGVIGARVDRTSVLIYGTHFSLIALVNVALWLDLHRSVPSHAHLVRSALALVLFVLGVAVGAVRPYLAQFIWFSTFALPFVSTDLTARIYRP